MLLSLTFAVRAKLGDSIEESNRRYNSGKPASMSAEDLKKPLLVGPGSSNLCYLANGMYIRVGFKNGGTFVMEYKHSGTSKVTEQELQAVLKENGDGGWANFAPTPAQKNKPEVQSYIRQCDGRIMIRPDKSIAYTIGHQRAIILVYKALEK